MQTEKILQNIRRIWWSNTVQISIPAGKFIQRKQNISCRWINLYTVLILVAAWLALVFAGQELVITKIHIAASARSSFLQKQMGKHLEDTILLHSKPVSRNPNLEMEEVGGHEVAKLEDLQEEQMIGYCHWKSRSAVWLDQSRRWLEPPQTARHGPPFKRIWEARTGEFPRAQGGEPTGGWKGLSPHQQRLIGPHRQWSQARLTMLWEDPTIWWIAWPPNIPSPRSRRKNRGNY